MSITVACIFNFILKSLLDLADCEQNSWTADKYREPSARSAWLLSEGWCWNVASSSDYCNTFSSCDCFKKVSIYSTFKKFLRHRLKNVHTHQLEFFEMLRKQYIFCALFHRIGFPYPNTYIFSSHTEYELAKYTEENCCYFVEISDYWSFHFNTDFLLCFLKQFTE